MMLSEEEIAAVLEQGFGNACYMDPQFLHNPSKYHDGLGIYVHVIGWALPISLVFKLVFSLSRRRARSKD